MKLQKKVRLPIAALGVTALCTGGVGIFASPAFAAPAAIALNSGATSIGVGNFGTDTLAKANTAYALKIQDSTLANAVLSVESAPSGGKLAFEQATNNSAASANGFTVVGGAINEVQRLTFSATPDAGDYTVTIGSNTTGVISAYTPAALSTALNAMLGDGNAITVTEPSPGVFQVTFGGVLAGNDYIQMTVNNNGLVDGATPVTVTPSTVTNASPNGAAYEAISNLQSSDYLYVTGNVPGEYKFRIFQDTNTNNVYDQADERSSSLVTLNVFDVRAATPATTDDVVPTFTTASPVGAGDEISAEIGFSKALSLSDARGSGVNTGLAGRLADLTWVDVNSSAAGVSTASDLNPVYSTSTGKLTHSIGTPTGAGTITLKGAVANTAPVNSSDYPAASSKAVTVTSNSVAALGLGVTTVEGKVIAGGSTSPTIKTGTSTVEYKVTAKDNASPTPKPVAGARVTFTLSGTDTQVAKLTADGTAGATTSTSKVFTATTNASGEATLKVTSSDTAAGMGYTITAASNGETKTLTPSYAAAAITAIPTTSTSAELTPAVGTATVTIKGKLVDQFDGAFIPGSSDSQQVVVAIGGSNYNAPVSSTGTFSFDYKPATAAAAGDTTGFTFTYGGVTSPSKNIRWASSAVASKIELSAPLKDAKDLNILGNAAPDSVQTSGVFGNATGEVTGTVFGADNAALAYKSVTLSGGEGVWFSTVHNPTATSTEKLTKTLDVVTNGSGAISGGYVFFTKPGANTVTATSGSTTVNSAVTVKAPSDGYSVTMDDVAGMPGSVLIVTGKVTDIFGNPVANEMVSLTTSNATVGTVGNSTPVTNNNGVFSTTFISGTNSDGNVDLSATLWGQTENAKPNADLVGAGVTGLKDGVYRATSTITIANVDLTLAATAKLTAGATGATAKLSGKYLPNTSVDIWSKQSGERAYSLLDSVKTNAAGNWSASTKVNKSTFFLAKSNGLSSASKQTQVYSKVSIGAKALKNGRVQVSANGDPNARGTITFWNGKKKLAAVTSDTKGVAKRTFSLGKKGQTKSVRVTFKAPGTGQGASKTLKIKLK